MPLEGNDLQHLYQTFATRQDINNIQTALGAILAKLDLVVPRDVHEIKWNDDAAWKRSTEERLDGIRGAIDVVKSGEAPWAIEMRRDMKSLREDLDTGDIKWATDMQKDLKDLKGERIPARVITAAGWIIPPLVTYFIIHALK